MQKVHIRMMQRALRLAARGMNTTDPNPRVGCVIAREGAIVGEGWHRRAGEPHAEIHALRQAGEAARGATVYVTLEPCCHQGKTPPCTRALIEAGVAHVLVAMTDPDPRVRGQGVAELRRAGIAVHTGLLAQAAEQLNPGFVSRMVRGRPWVRCKLAMSLDGRTAMASGESRWITSPAAREDVQRLRARSSAVMTGMGTVVADDPRLDVRIGASPRQPLRVILDPSLRTPHDARILRTPGRVLMVAAEGVSRERLVSYAARGVEVKTVPPAEGGVSLPEVLRCLAGYQVNELLLEAGAKLSGAMLQAGLVDEFVFYVAPHLMGSSARGLFHLPGLERMAQRIELDVREIRAVGRDWRISATVKGNRSAWNEGSSDFINNIK